MDEAVKQRVDAMWGELGLGCLNRLRSHAVTKRRPLAAAVFCIAGRRLQARRTRFGTAGLPALPAAL
jgi:hypothetical protein